MDAGIRFGSDLYIGLSIDEESMEITVVGEKTVEGVTQTGTGVVVWDD